ncbi:RNA polymerase sigma factor [Pseudoalteromonas piscicida]|uniref:DNA-directed RNA polymerase subunit sigma-70 n=1 Tax=Pseudoalteromonas piscicida TaxID=43662 RepID=A0A2A5JQE8_PSEO7|nr:sigma-70 family RNA polymerase sigma factor [Pseudoalteromonas piscicida]PCK31655.1 DNA-directed RNA polymerase subunit sigma-70 [Pseudoalteromonas piscicida]
MSKFAIKWAQVISDNKGKVLAYLNSILKCPYLAEDALQDTFIRLCGMSSTQNAEISNTTSFCFQVARNIAIDMLRKQNREGLVALEATHVDHMSDKDSNIEIKVELAQLDKRMDSTIQKLSTRHQNIFSFYRSGRFKQKEIAKLYKISPTLVNFMLKEAINSCQKELVRH